MSRPSKFDAAIDTFFGPDTGHDEPPVRPEEREGFLALAVSVGLSALTVIAVLVLAVRKCSE